MFHICTADSQGGLSKYSFLCPNGTIFNQNYFICDWWFNFDCSEAENLYSINEDIAAERAEIDAAASDSLNAYAAPPTDYAGALDAAAPTDYEAALDTYAARQRKAKRIGKSSRAGRRKNRRQGRRQQG